MGSEGRTGRNVRAAMILRVLHDSVVKRSGLAAILLLAVAAVLAAQDGAPGTDPASVCRACIRAHMEFLASDALRGRGSGTHDELVAATYIATELERVAVAPAGDDGGYLQNVALMRRRVLAPPRLEFATAAGNTVLRHGLDIVVLRLGAPSLSGPLQKLSLERSQPSQVKPGAFVLLSVRPDTSAEQLQEELGPWMAAASMILVPEVPAAASIFRQGARRMPSLPEEIAGVPAAGAGQASLVMLSKRAERAVSSLRSGTPLRLRATVREEKLETRNVIGEIAGTDSQHAILLTAHMDHLGVGASVNGDSIYNGADDDASGVCAVLELARALAAGPRPRRTVIFALFGSEETGSQGAQYFRAHPPLPLSDLVANLEFEMLGRPDPALAPHTLFLTGWNRTNLGPSLSEHGARLAADPHPAEHFFRRSDNYALALEGVVAQTVSSYGLHKDYHQPSDEVSRIDFAHMDEAIGSLIGPVRWLADSDFTPQWVEGGKP